MTLAAGTRLGPYQVIGPLGAGGMGEVYRARDERLSRSVALKVLPGEISADKGRLERFEKEARAASSLNHPNIVTIYDIGSAESLAYIAMELVEGRTLREILYTGPIALRRLLSLSAQIADGLAKAHAAGIVHRDLKPENLMVTKDGFVKMLDFGLAKLVPTGFEASDGSHLPTVTRGTEPGTVLGTVGYMSPEQTSGHPLDFRSDQFSLGAILYEMASGKRAFDRATAVQTLSAIIQDEPEPLSAAAPKIPANLVWIIERCLAKDPEERYGSTKDLARDLANVRDHLSEAVSGAAPAAAPRHRMALKLSLAGTALAAVALLSGKLLWKPPPPSPPEFQRVTFRRGGPAPARFSPDGQTVVYSAAWEGGPKLLYSMRLDNPESRPFDLPPAYVLSISSAGELAILLNCCKDPYPPGRLGMLARVPLVGGAPREVLEDVYGADWSPDGKELAVIRKVGDLRRLEFPIGKMLYEAPMIWSPRVSPRGNLVAFLEVQEGERHLCIVDAAGRKQTLARDPGFELAWSPEGDEIWTAWAKLEAVTLTGRRRVLTKFPEPLAGGVQDVSRDGRGLLLLGEFSNGIVVLPPGETRERELSWLGHSQVSGISRDGKRLLFDDAARSITGGVYFRSTDESLPPILLAEGAGSLGLSPDSKWAIVVRDGRTSEFELVPTGPGEKKILKVAGIDTTQSGATFFPDGKRILIEVGRPPRCYVQDLDGGSPRAITPEGVHSLVISPDGQMLAALDAESRVFLYPVEGGAPKAASGPAETGELKAWSADGRSLYVSERVGHGRIKVFRRDLASGRRDLWKELAPADPAGIGSVEALIAPNGAYAYGYNRFVGNLYLVRGLK